jgi:hypothetical protein
VLLAIDHPFIAFECCEGLHAKTRIGGIVVCATRHLGEGQRTEPRSVVDEIGKKALLLLVNAEKDDGLDAEAGPKKCAGNVDINGGEFFCGNREVECRNVCPADFLRKQSLDEACLDGLPVKWPRRIEALIRLVELTDRLSDILQHRACESARTIPKCGLFFAEREINTHCYPSAMLSDPHHLQRHWLQ